LYLKICNAVQNERPEKYSDILAIIQVLKIRNIKKYITICKKLITEKAATKDFNWEVSSGGPALLCYDKTRCFP